jgi:hypothetical protein
MSTAPELPTVKAVMKIAEDYGIDLLPRMLPSIATS